MLIFCKLTFIILIFYLKINGLKTSPVNESHGSHKSSNGAAAAATTVVVVAAATNVTTEAANTDSSNNNNDKPLVVVLLPATLKPVNSTKTQSNGSTYNVINNNNNNDNDRNDNNINIANASDSNFVSVGSNKFIETNKTLPYNHEVVNESDGVGNESKYYWYDVEERSLTSAVPFENLNENEALDPAPTTATTTMATDNSGGGVISTTGAATIKTTTATYLTQAKVDKTTATFNKMTTTSYKTKATIKTTTAATVVSTEIPATTTVAENNEFSSKKNDDNDDNNSQNDNNSFENDDNNSENNDNKSENYDNNTKNDDNNSENDDNNSENANNNSDSIFWPDNIVSSSDIDRILFNYDNIEEDSCLLDDIKQSFMWWSFPNGTLSTDLATTDAFLDLSSRNISEDSDLYHKATRHNRLNKRVVIAFSAANNLLPGAPFKTLSIMNESLKYLTLKGNTFKAHSIDEQNVRVLVNDTSKNPPDNYKDYTPYTHQYTCSNNSGTDDPETHNIFIKESIAWATFPPLPELIELDISNCHIEYIIKEAFQNLTNLRRLFMSQNKMIQIPADTFYHAPHINYLDLSFTNAIEVTIPYPNLEAIFNLIYGVKIYQTAFRHLPNLEYLDLSHTKLTRNSAMAFTHLSGKLKFLSLCYTAFPLIGSAMFKNTALIALDLSGNPSASYKIIDDTFDGISDTLKYLFFEKSNIKELDWLQCLSNVRVLGLAGNNINAVTLETFEPLQQLQVLDLTSNHIGNWYTRAFTHNTKLRVLNLRDNNINIITSEMLKDFQSLEYLGFGNNDFVCDCLLREMVDMAADNNKEADCAQSLLTEAQQVISDNINWLGRGKKLLFNATTAKVMMQQPTAKETNSEHIMGEAIMSRLLPQLRHSKRQLLRYNAQQKRFRLRYVTEFYRSLRDDVPQSQCQQMQPVSATLPLYRTDKLNSSNFKFQLLDYDEQHYWCFNETVRMQFIDLNCQTRAFVDDEIAAQLHSLTRWVLGGVGGLIGIALLGVLIYLKRWHIHYYYSSLKSAALVSVASKEAADKFNSLAESDPNLVYDIFISYCQNDREWVLEELLPNVEVAGDISICMHERDFQIGVPILDNIISCMDRSKALMLIISTNFLLSHWCQFEMHLAQHRMFEASKEHLILVFLEDIPRSKRPKTLQYLMEVKTYIKWPSAKGKNKQTRPDEKKLFWKRLKRSLVNIGLNRGESMA